jgi:anaerobic selenocysteine-containing dehydrogenase
MHTKRAAILLFGFLLFCAQNLSLWGQQEQGPESSDYAQQLEQRIQILEQIVKELQRQRPSDTSSTESISKAEAVQAEQVGSPPLVQEPVVDRALKISGLVFGDLYWNAAGHDESLKDRNGFWFRRIYLGFDKAMTEQLEMRVRFEMNSAGDFRSNAKLEPFAKDVYLRWKFADQHQTYLGLSSTPTWNVVEGFWSYRSLEKTALDLQRMGALITLNLLVGNPDWKGGLAVGGSHWHESGGRAGTPYDFAKIHPAKFGTFGVRSNREKASYEKSTLFEGYPAKRPWYPFTGNLYQEVIPSAEAAYPYPIKALVLHMGTPAMACPAGHKQIDTLRDPAKIPLLIACDIVIGESSMYADYIFPDTSIWERWGTPHITPAMLVTVSKVRQPTVGPLVETTEVDGVEMPINLEALLIALAKKLGLPGFGKDALGPGFNLDHQDDWFLKLVANIAMEEKGDVVPTAHTEETELFLKARSHLPKSVFDLERLKHAAGAKYWPHIVYVLNRGGRFEDSYKMHKGDQQAHPFKALFSLYVEKVATARNSMNGQYFEGLPRHEPIQFADGTQVVSNGEYPLHLITYKEIFGGHSRTMPGNLWLGELLDENAVLMNRRDAERFDLNDRDRVRLGSPTNPEGVIDLGNGEIKRIEGKIKILEGIRPGVVAISWHFGHWAYGSRDVLVDGEPVKGDPTRARGILPNPLMLEDTRVGNVCLTDPIGGSASYFDTPVNVVKV